MAVTRRLKVFLLNFPEAPAPAGFTVDFFRSLFFGTDSPGNAPAPDSSILGPTASQYFLTASDGNLRLEGTVASWVNAPISDAVIPHWQQGMQNPTSTSSRVNFGESWPVVVALTLRANGFTSDRYSSAEALRQAVLALPGGAAADRLVFLYSGLGADGVKREFGQVSDTLNLMSMSNVSTRAMPNGNVWSSLWDDGWTGLPGFLCSHILRPVDGVTWNADGTLTATQVPATNLRMTTLAWLYHEYSHLVAGFPDLYGPEYEPWFDWDIMGGPWRLTHFPMPIASYLRAKAGWLQYRHAALEDVSTRLHPFESHNEALRLWNGRADEFLVAENRDLVDWTPTPPGTRGRCLLLYRLHERRRLRAAGVRKITQLLRQQTFSVGQPVPTQSTAFGQMPDTTRNALGELWWEIRPIEDAGGGDLQLGLRPRALDLVGNYRRADWEGTAPGQEPRRLQHDFFSGSAGHVVLLNKTLAVRGIERYRALFLHPRWAANATVSGRYPLGDLGASPIRIYAKLAMPDEAIGSDGTVLGFYHGSSPQTVDLAPGQYKELCLDFQEPDGVLQIVGQSKTTPNLDWIYILDCAAVALPTAVFDFIQEAPNAQWSNGSTTLPFGIRGQPAGEASHRGRSRLNDGIEYGPIALFTHPQWVDGGFIQGTYANVPVPATGAYLRGLAGFLYGRSVVGGASVSIMISAGAQTDTPVSGADITTLVDPAQEGLSIFEMPIPRSYWGRTASFTLNVSATWRDPRPPWAEDRSSGQDWVTWPYLSLTTA